jgi:ribosomal-protein-alanine N-acetyltransferase
MLKIEEAKERDLKCIAKIEKMLFDKQAWSYEQILSEFKNNFSKILVIKNKEDIIGYLIYRKIGEESELLRIGIKKDYQKQGFGTYLIKEFLERQKREGVKKVFLEVDFFNKPAYKLYRNVGFNELYLRKRYYSKTDAIVMIKNLT